MCFYKLVLIKNISAQNFLKCRSLTLKLFMTSNFFLVKKQNKIDLSIVDDKIGIILICCLTFVALRHFPGRAVHLAVL